jgi:holo-[acyl-carrier protein] synthase
LTASRRRENGGVVGLGLDLVEVERVAEALDRHGERLVRRICCEREREQWSRETDGPRTLAIRFAVKEACLKALGTGWADGLAFPQVEVDLRSGSTATIRLRGAAEERARRSGASSALASVADAGGVIAALVVIA